MRAALFVCSHYNGFITLNLRYPDISQDYCVISSEKYEEYNYCQIALSISNVTDEVGLPTRKTKTTWKGIRNGKFSNWLIFEIEK